MPVYEYSVKNSKKNTKYMFRLYVERFGKRVQITRRGFNSKKEATKAEADMISGLTKCTHINLTFKRLYDDYIDDYEFRNKFTSLRKERSKFKNHILPFFENANVDSISLKDYKDWQKIIYSKELSDKSNASLHISMVSILNYAVKNYGVSKNVAHDVGPFKKRGIEKEIVIWNHKEFLAFMKSITDIRDALLFRFIYSTGLRFGEAAGIMWNNYNGESVFVNKTIPKELRNKERVILPPKTPSSNRIVTLDSKLIKALNNYKEYLKQTYTDFSDDWYIFGFVSPCSHTTISRRKDNYCKMAGVKKLTLHQFRHTHVSYLVKAGVPITEISKRLGHKNPQITLQIYAKMIEGDDDLAVNAMEKLFEDED